MNYPHILEEKTSNKKLKFLKEIDPFDGTHHKTTTMPQDWKNVRHITGDLFYAWDEDPLLGCVYLAVWE